MLENNGVFKGETTIDGIKIHIEGYLVIRNIYISKEQVDTMTKVKCTATCVHQHGGFCTKKELKIVSQWVAGRYPIECDDYLFDKIRWG